MGLGPPAASRPAFADETPAVPGLVHSRAGTSQHVLGIGIIILTCSWIQGNIVEKDKKDFSNKELPMIRLVISLVLGVLAVFVLAVGSILIIGTLLQIGTSASDQAFYPSNAGADAFVFTVDLFWPAIVVIVWIVGSAALLVARRLAYVGQLFIMYFLIAIGVVFALHVADAPAAGHNTPLLGVGAAFVIILFLVLNIGAMYGLWQIILGCRKEKRQRLLR